MVEVKFAGFTCQAKTGRYVSGQNSIELFDAEDGEPVAVASVSIPHSIDTDMVAIKNYSENEGILDVLIDSGMISEPVASINNGYVTIPICKLLK